MGIRKPVEYDTGLMQMLFYIAGTVRYVLAPSDLTGFDCSLRSANGKLEARLECVNVHGVPYVPRNEYNFTVMLNFCQRIGDGGVASCKMIGQSHSISVFRFLNGSWLGQVEEAGEICPAILCVHRQNKICILGIFPSHTLYKRQHPLSGLSQVKSA